MWVGPGGFIGNFAFRFSKKQKFSSLRLSLSLNISNCSFTFYAKQAFDSRPVFVRLSFFCRRRSKAAFLRPIKKKRQETRQDHILVSCRARETRGRTSGEKRTSTTLDLLLLMMIVL